MPISVKSNWKIWTTGGGKILLTPSEKTILISGSSTKYGRGDHQKAQELIEKEYLGYEVEWKSEMHERIAE